MERTRKVLAERYGGLRFTCTIVFPYTGLHLRHRGYGAYTRIRMIPITKPFHTRLSNPHIVHFVDTRDGQFNVDEDRDMCIKKCYPVKD